MKELDALRFYVNMLVARIERLETEGRRGSIAQDMARVLRHERAIAENTLDQLSKGGTLTQNQAALIQDLSKVS